MKAVIFDLDGTLLDTLEDIADAVNAALARCNYPPHTPEEYRTFIGHGADNLVFQALPEEARHAKDINAQCFAMFHEEYQKNWNAKTKPYAGVPEMLDALAARGVKLAVLSNKPQDFTCLCVKEWLSRWTFDAVIGAREDIPLKPDPAGALAIARQLNIPPDEFAYAGDSGIDMRTARAAGMFAVGVTWGFRGRDELDADGAQAVIGYPSALPVLLSS